MSTLRFAVETISPMFLRGADGETPELRPPSFKGLLRYWWRAAKVLPVNELHEQEGRIFGSAAGDEGRRSTVTIRLEKRGSLSYSNHQPVPHRGFRLSAFDPGQQFSIVLHRLPHCPISLDELKHTMIVALALGGVGFRSRRGFGAMRIRRINGTRYDTHAGLEDSVLPSLKVLNPNFVYVYKDYAIHYTGSEKPPYPWIKRAERTDDVFYGDDVQTLLREISQATHDYNSQYTGAPDPRFASPEYVTTHGDSTDVWGIVTSLHLPQSTRNKLRHGDSRHEFRSAVIDEQI
ncbi:MAG: type III-B CRISPR module RAMP protein Cmr1 [Longimonas sp.]|uniref:type III-B CRISPR module RAMP protein Cmr1 n=1 Tax=Longimonas sp. TaxID=2039626 RepID=UPI0033542FAF